MMRKTVSQQIAMIHDAKGHSKIFIELLGRMVLICSYCTVVLYIRIIKDKDFSPQNITPKPVQHLLCDTLAELVRHS